MRYVWILCLSFGLVACDHGLAPPPLPEYGAIAGEVTFSGRWPPEDSLYDLRFVALRFVPQDTLELILRYTEMVRSRTLNFYVARDTFRIGGVEPGFFPYAGVVQQYGPGLLDWRPVGLAEPLSFEVRPGETTYVRVQVDFDHPPPFPPE